MQHVSCRLANPASADHSDGMYMVGQVRHLTSSGGMPLTAIRGKKWRKRGTQACLQLPLRVPLTGTRESCIGLQRMNLGSGVWDTSSRPCSHCHVTK